MLDQNLPLNKNKGLSFVPKKDKKTLKVLLYGDDGTGKSTFAEKYCKDHQLHPIVIDIDGTNFTKLGENRAVAMNSNNDKTLTRSIINTIKAVHSNEEFDTIIIDGASSLADLLCSEARGLAKFSDRATHLKQIIKNLNDYNINVIWVGHDDFGPVDVQDGKQKSSFCRKICASVNESYCCTVEKGNFTVEQTKNREPKKTIEFIEK